VLRWLSRAELLEQYETLSHGKRAQTPFALLQRSIWAFQNGLDDRAWTALGRALRASERFESIEKNRALQSVAIPRLFARRKATRPVDRARQLLLDCRQSGSKLSVFARNRMTSLALLRLLEAEQRQATEETTASGKGRRRSNTRNELSKLQKLCRSYADQAMGSERRDAARRALLRFNRKSQEYVYRLAARHPRGSTRSAILAEVDNHGLNDRAAKYLARFLESPRSTWRTRSAEVLLAIGSAAVLPELRKARKDAIARMRRSGAAAAAPRANFSVIKQQNYIADFDVEVASNATIAKPVVRTAQDGVVLDVRVLGVSTYRFWVRHVKLLDKVIAGIERGDG